LYRLLLSMGRGYAAVETSTPSRRQESVNVRR
jgi:hypothetical protein